MEIEKLEEVEEMKVEEMEVEETDERVGIG